MKLRSGDRIDSWIPHYQREVWQPNRFLEIVQKLDGLGASYLRKLLEEIEGRIKKGVGRKRKVSGQAYTIMGS